jgi:hypothetical protein
MTSNYVIEKNIPLVNKTGPKPHFPFLEMELGDSFLVADVEKRKVYSAGHAAGKALNRTFKTRTVEGGVRVWRVA